MIIIISNRFNKYIPYNNSSNGVELSPRSKILFIIVVFATILSSRALVF